MVTAVIGGLVTSTLRSLACIPIVFARIDATGAWLGPQLPRFTTVDLNDTSKAVEEDYC